MVPRAPCGWAEGAGGGVVRRVFEGESGGRFDGAKGVPVKMAWHAEDSGE